MTLRCTPSLARRRTITRVIHWHYMMASRRPIRIGPTWLWRRRWRRTKVNIAMRNSQHLTIRDPAAGDDIFLHWLDLPSAGDWSGKASPFSVAASVAADAEALRFIAIIHLSSLRINTGTTQTNIVVERIHGNAAEAVATPIARSVGYFRVTST